MAMRQTINMFVGPSLSNLAKLVEQFVLKYDGIPDYSQLYVAGCSDDSPLLVSKPDGSSAYCESDADGTTQWFISLYNDTNTVATDAGFERLYICLYLPLYEDTSWALTNKILSAIKQSGRPFEVLVLGLGHDFCNVLQYNDENVNILSLLSPQREIMRQIVDSAQNGMIERFVFLQNTNENSRSLDLDLVGLANVLGEFCMMVTDNYTGVFPANVQAGRTAVMTFGLSAVWFQRQYFVDYLLSKAYVYALDREKVDDTEVDSNAVADDVTNILNPLVGKMKDFYATKLSSEIKQKKDVAEAKRVLDEEMDALQAEMFKFVYDEKKSLPEKRAFFAQLLAEDDELLKYALFDANQPVLDDMAAFAMEEFIKEDNANVVVQRDAAGKIKSCRGGELTGANDIKHPASNKLFLANYKQKRNKIKELTKEIREREEKLRQTQASLAVAQESNKILTKSGFTYKGTTYKLLGDADQPPLEETYTPLKKSEYDDVDLRADFSEIRDQGSLGSCTAFATTSILEYMFNRIGENGDKVKLSPRFVYYNVCHDENGNLEDKGSSFFDVYKSLKDTGACEESFCKYIDDESQEKPSPDSYENAGKYKVLKAMEVTIGKEDIIATLSEGYPVGISVRVFPSFASDSNGFVFAPTDAETASADKLWHAMTIVGYSKSKDVFVVRNSWGAGFGDNGYCYMSFSYLQDYCRQATVVTEVTGGGISDKALPHATVFFAMTDANIRYALLRINLEDKKRLLKKEEAEYQKCSQVYQLQIIELEDDNKRKAICDKALKRKRNKLSFLNKEYQGVLSQIHHHGKRFYKLLFTGGALLLMAILLILSIILQWQGIAIASSALLSLAACFFIISIVNYHSDNKELKGRLTEINQQKETINNEISDFEFRMYVYGMQIKAVFNLKDKSENMFNKLKSFVNNLATWKKEESEKINRMTPYSHGLFHNILNNSKLYVFFDSKKDELVKNVSFFKCVDEYNTNDSNVMQFKRRAKNIVEGSLLAYIQDFDMVDFVLGDKKYEYVDSFDNNSIKDVMNNLDKKSVAFAEVEQNTINTTTNGNKALFFYVGEQQEKQHNMERKMGAFIDPSPASQKITTHDELILFKSEFFDLNSLSVMRTE